MERLARILTLNKSGFYHYFGDLENFAEQLVNYHYRMFDPFLRDVSACKNIDPEYINCLIKHKTTVMVQIHLVRNKTNRLYYGAHQKGDERVGHAVLPIWSRHVDLHNNLNLAFQYHSIVRDMLYSRVNLENFNYDYLRTLSDESRELVKKIVQEKENVVVKS